MNEAERNARHEEVKSILAMLCMTSRESGRDAAKHSATSHLVAAAAYLKETEGSEKTCQILDATIETICPGSPGRH